MRPFPGTGGYSPFVGGGAALVGALEEGLEDAGYGTLTDDLPGERLLEVRGPRGGVGRNLGLLLSLALIAAPCLALAFDWEAFFPRAWVETFWWTIGGATLVGLLLGAVSASGSLYERGRAVVTTAGLGIEVPPYAVWVPWEEVQGWERLDDLIELQTAQGQFRVTATEDEAGRLIAELDQRGVERGRLSTITSQLSEGLDPPSEAGETQAL